MVACNGPRPTSFNPLFIGAYLRTFMLNIASGEWSELVSIPFSSGPIFGHGTTYEVEFRELPGFNPLFIGAYLRTANRPVGWRVALVANVGLFCTLIPSYQALLVLVYPTFPPPPPATRAFRIYCHKSVHFLKFHPVLGALTLCFYNLYGPYGAAIQ